MIRHVLVTAALLALGLFAAAQSQSVTGTIIRPGPPAAQTPVPKPPAQNAPKAQAPARPKSPTPKIETAEQTTDLQVGNENYKFVKRVCEIKGKEGNDATTDWWEIRDAAGKAVYREDLGVSKVDETGYFEQTVEVTASAFKADGGPGILVTGMDLPSAPNSGTWVQVFGRAWGPTLQPLKAFGPAISTDGEFTGIGVDHRRDAPKPTRPGITIGSLHDVLKFRVWTGNFDIEYPVLINWIAGRVEPAMRCLRSTAKGQIERCSYPIHIDAHRDAKDLTFVRLFQEPEEGFGTPEHVVIKPDSRVEFLTAEVPVSWHVDANNIFISAEGPGADNTWLKVRIDGKEGWIHTQEDFAAVGLPQSG